MFGIKKKNGRKEILYRLNSKDFTDDLNNLKSLKLASGISLVAGTWSLLFEIYFFHNFSVDIYFARLIFTIASFIIFMTSFWKLGPKIVTGLLHLLVFMMISSFLYTIYKLPSTLFINSQILSLLIFTTALIFSWDAKNQIIVAIYYNILFASSIIFNSSSVYLLPNLFASVVLVALISILSVAASSIILNLKKLYLSNVNEINFLFNNAPLGICKIDRSGNLSAYNAYMEGLLKIIDNESTLNLFDLINNPDLRPKMEDALSANAGTNIKCTIKDANGADLFLRIIPKETGGIIELLVINETADVLASIEKEELNKKLLNEKKLKIELLAKINHEVRTPLNAIISFFEMVEENIMKSMDEVKNYSRIVKTASQDLLRIINNFIDYAKLENATFDISKGLFNLADEVNDILTMLMPLAQSKNIRLLFRNNNKGRDLVHSDVVKVRQIIINLISNSLKFTQKGSVTVTCSNENKADHKHEFTVSVKDTGPGISEEKLSEIFNPFLSHADERSLHYSSGLGLAICKEFTDMLGGNIYVASKIGEGSEFIFSIPFEYDFLGDRKLGEGIL